MGFYFSKSKYCLLWQCPKQVWLYKYRPELKKHDPAVEARMTAGQEVGELAKSYFGPYTDVSVVNEDGSLDLDAMLAKTQILVDMGEENICEASFCYDGLYCAVDILHQENGGYAIYEVKSSTHEAEIYGVDIAYQKYVLEHCGVKVTGTYLICIDSDYVRGEELDIHKLFKKVDMKEWVALEYPNVRDRLVMGEQIMESEVEPECDMGAHCAHPYDCAYWDYCSRNLPKNNVFDLYVTRKPALKHYEKGVISFVDALLSGGLGDRQKRQINHTLTDCGNEIDKDGIRKFLSTLSYPIYFLDFETMQQVVPQYPGATPYAQIPFQYSLHYIEAPGGELKHKEFLAESGTDPRRAIAESLCKDIPMHTCVTAYNQKFERGRLNELALLFPDLADHLLNIRNNIKDLLAPFQNGYYYNRAMGCSFSIKSVLPALFPDDPELDYHNLEGIHNGTEAMNVFPKLKDMDSTEATKARQNLLAYCKLDTYAMVKVWLKLCEVGK